MELHNLIFLVFSYLRFCLNCCIWVKFLNPLTQIIKSFLCKRCECIEVLAIKILSKDNIVHPYAVIVVLTHTITQNPKIAQVHPVCRFVLDSAEQQSSCVEVVSAMVVIMQHQLPLIIDVEVLVFFIFLSMQGMKRRMTVKRKRKLPSVKSL